MDSTRRTSILSRTLGLVAIGLVAAALALLELSADEAVSVPDGARAGQLTLEPCEYATERGDRAADCGTLVVPENRARPGSRLIALPVTRIRARSPERGAEPVFRLEGGPGLSNMKFPQASRFAERRDVVLVGYRGVDGSSVLDCPEVESAMRRSEDLLGRESLGDQADGFRSCAERLRDDGVDLAGYTLTQRVEDLEAARRALGYDRVDLISESAGTRTAMVYAWRHPRSLRRSVMVGANPPGHFLWDSRTIDRQIRRYSELCAEDEDCRYRTSDLAGLIERGAGDIPARWGPLGIKRGNVRTATFWGLIESGEDAAPLSAPMTLDTWQAAADGDASGFWFQSVATSLIFPRAQVWGDLASIGRADANYARERFARGEDPGSILGNPGSRLIWAGGELADAWPPAPDEDEYDRVRTSHVETLVVSGTLDFAAPAENATRELMPHLPNGRQVILRELGHTNDFWTEQSRAGTHLVNTFLDSGRVDRSLYRHRAIEFDPPLTQTVLGKGLAGAMAGPALVTILALLSMRRRVRRNGRIGPRAGALLRSVFPLVTGFGGWFLAALAALTSAPGVPIDGEALVVFSMGVPVALGIHLAWVDRAWAAETRRLGLVGATMSALSGGWLGLHAAGESMLALVTTIAGAAAAANLFLIVVGVARERALRARGQSASPGASGAAL